MVEGFDCLYQTCILSNEDYFEDSYDFSLIKTYSICDIVGVQFIKEQETVKTINIGDQNTTMLRYYSDNVVNFIPNSIFETFPNLEYFWIREPQQFSNLKAYYLKNAYALKLFDVENQKGFTKLDANVFFEAPNLEHVNLQNNGLEYIDKSAFGGLKKIKGIYLKGNNIRQFYHSSVLNHDTLQVLDLLYNDCISKKYQNFAQIQALPTELNACSSVTHAELAELTKINNDQYLVDYKNTDQKLKDIIESISSTLNELANNQEILEETQKTEFLKLSSQIDEFVLDRYIISNKK